jgi:hypothetical protein
LTALGSRPAPVIALYSFFGVQTVPMLIQQIMLAELFIPTDPSVLPVKRSGGCDKNRGSFTAAYIQDAT